MDRLAKLFVLNRAGLNVKRGAVVFGGMLVPFVVLTALGQQQYFLPAAPRRSPRCSRRCATPAASTGPVCR